MNVAAYLEYQKDVVLAIHGVIGKSLNRYESQIQAARSRELI